MSKAELIKKLEHYLSDKSRILVSIHYGTLRVLYEYLKGQPDIVRCKDCEWWDIGSTEECSNSDSVCFRNGWCKPDWFCADGERRKGGETE